MARRDWVLEHILAVILIPSAVVIAVIIVLMIAGYR
jgi:nitrogen fixation protein FixH